MTTDEYLAIAVIAAAPFLFVWILSIYFKPIEKVFEHVYRGVHASHEPGPGLVNLRFRTYRGVLAWVTMTEHDFYATPRDARILLKRFFWFNFRYGLLAAGGVFVPFLTVGNYIAQKKSIARQARDAGIDNHDAEVYDVDEVYDVEEFIDADGDAVIDYEAAVEVVDDEDEIIDVD